MPTWQSPLSKARTISNDRRFPRQGFALPRNDKWGRPFDKLEFDGWIQVHHLALRLGELAQRKL